MTPGRSTDSFKELSINIQTTAYPFPLHLSLINPHSLQPSFTLLQPHSLFFTPFRKFNTFFIVFYCFTTHLNAFITTVNPPLSTVNRSRDPSLVLNPLLQPYRLFHHFSPFSRSWTHFGTPRPVL